MMTRSSIDQAISTLLLELSRRKKPQLAEVLDPDGLVTDLALSSLDLAEVVATLEFQLRLDPFSSKVSIASIRTVADLKSAYHSCL